MARRAIAKCVAPWLRTRPLLLKPSRRLVWLFASTPFVISCAVASTEDPLFEDFSSAGEGPSPDSGVPSSANYGAAGNTGAGGTGPVVESPPAAGGAATEDPPPPGACGPGLKLCGGLCLAPGPSTGCGPTDCTPCPPPPDNAEASCDAEQCAWACTAGYLESGGECLAENGAGGANGSAGMPGTGGTGAGGTPGSGGWQNGSAGWRNGSGGEALGSGGWADTDAGRQSGSGGWQADDGGLRNGDDAGTPAGDGGRRNRQ